MKNYEMFNFVREFTKFDGLEGFDFLIRLNKNKRIFQQEIQDLQNTRDGNPGFKKYKEDVQSLLILHSDKDENNKPIITPAPGQPGQGNYSLTENREAFNLAHKELITKYGDDIAKQEVLDKQFNDNMDNDIMIPPLYIKEDILPKDINSAQMNLIFPLIKFKPEDVKPENIEQVK